MDKDSQSDHAIVPEDRNKQLSLPLEMVQRGLELAIRIEQKLSIQPLPARPARKEYTVRCNLVAMEWARKDDGSRKLNESEESITDRPVYLVLSVNGDGVHISCASKNPDFVGMEGSEDRYRLLNCFNDLNPFKIPASSLGLFYTLTHPADASPGHFSRLSKGALENLSYKIGPSGGQPGYKGPVTRDANRFFDINRDCVETVIIYVSMLVDPNAKQSLVAKDPLLKLSFVAIDKKGVQDLVASRELYHAILEIKDPLSAQEVYVGVEELYRNIPTNITQKENWKQWENAYVGRYVKEKGRFASVSLHRRTGRLFIIVTLADGEGSIENDPHQAAIMVEDAHQIELGKKEGSFCLDGNNWLYLGETYAFKGRVSGFSLFDEELRQTDSGDLVIVKASINDLDLE